MDAQSLTTEIELIPLARLFRVPAEVYRGMVEHGLFRAEEVALTDGLLVGGAGNDPSERLYRMPLGVYDRVANLGLLKASDKAELLDGLLVKIMTKGDRHIAATRLIWKALDGVVPAGWLVAKEDPVALPGGLSEPDSMPEPDVMVLRGGIRDYLGRKPGPSETALVVEVADSSLRDDRSKLVRYARGGVPAAWLVNLIDNTVEVHAEPSAAGIYQEMTIYHGADEVPVVIDGLEVGRLAVADLLP